MSSTAVTGYPLAACRAATYPTSSLYHFLGNNRVTARSIIDAAQRSRLAIALTCLAVVCAANRPGAAQVEISGVRVGVDGHYRVGHWTVVRVDVSSPAAIEGGRLELHLPDDEGAPCINKTSPA